jgi:superfamily II DNA or RNA helicase
MSLFHGRSDAYARRWEKEGRSGYSPAYEFSWEEFMAHKRRGGSLKDFSNKRPLPLTEAVVQKHLLGLEVIGIFPILPDHTSYFLAADFDGERWLKEAKSYIDAASRVQLNAYLERSRSGNGGHVWIFFSESCPCYKSRQLGLDLIRRAAGISEFEKEMSFDRLFPNQDTLSKGGFGNLIALPLQGKSIVYGNTVFLNPETETPFADQWEFLKEAKQHTVHEIDEAFQKLSVQKTGVPLSLTVSERGLTISVANQIVLSRSELTPELVSFLREELNFANTEYLTKRRLGKSTYRVEKYFKLIEDSGNVVSIPRGFLDKLVGFLNDHGIGHSVDHDYPSLGEVAFKSCIELTPIQSEVVKSALNREQGVIVAPSGAGKTIIGLELIARRKLPALILVHRKQIFDQWVDRIQEFLGIPKTQIGQYSGIKKRVGEQITVSLLQSLGRKADLSEWKNRFGTIIVDECHHIPASTYRHVLAKLNTHYLYGLTATPKRKHNDEKLIYAYIGNVVAQMEGVDVPPPVPPPKSPVLEVVVRETALAVPFRFKTDLFELLAKTVCFDTARNNMIVHDIVEQAAGGKRVLLLSERKEHLEILRLHLKGRCEIIVVCGDDSTRARVSKFKQIADGHYQVILSTGQFFGEGVDVRGITCLILAFPFSFEGKLVQHIGRLRESGDQRLIIDYRDRKIPFLESQFKHRERYYRKVATKIRAESSSDGLIL